MFKKRVTVLFITVVLTVTMMAGCGAKAEESSETGAAKTESAQTENAQAEGNTEAAEAIVLKIGNGVSETNPQTISLQKFASELEAATEGRIKTELFPNCTLGSDEEMLEMVRTNTLQMSTGNLTIKDYVPEMYAFGLPFLFRSYADAYHYLTTAPVAQDMWNKIEDKANLKFVGLSMNGSRCLTTKDVEVKSPADMQGILTRSMTSEVSQNMISALGGTPVPMSYSELYVALQTGVVQAQDNGMANVYESKFYEVQDYFYRTEHGYIINAFYVSPEFWAQLTDADKETFSKLFKQIVEDEYAAAMEDFYKEAETAAVAGGMKIVEQSELDMQAFYDSADAMIEEKYMNDPVYADVVTDVKEYLGY